MIEHPLFKTEFAQKQLENNGPLLLLYVSKCGKAREHRLIGGLKMSQPARFDGQCGLADHVPGELFWREESQSLARSTCRLWDLSLTNGDQRAQGIDLGEAGRLLSGQPLLFGILQEGHDAGKSGSLELI